jgi:secretion/DNA translocation related TadE-like protein
MSSLYALGIGLVFVSAGAVGSAEGAYLIAREQARTAADLGALAGAARAGLGADAACARAAEVVRANAARADSCVLDGLDLTLSVTTTTATGAAATAAARAGPVRAAPDGSEIAGRRSRNEVQPQVVTANAGPS